MFLLFKLVTWWKNFVHLSPSHKPQRHWFLTPTHLLPKSSPLQIIDRFLFPQYTMLYSSKTSRTCNSSKRGFLCLSILPNTTSFQNFKSAGICPICAPSFTLFLRRLALFIYLISSYIGTSFENQKKKRQLLRKKLYFSVSYRKRNKIQQLTIYFCGN